MINKTDEPEAGIDKIVKTTIAELVGAEPEDVHLEDRLMEELHMRPSEISDLLENLKNKGLETKEVDIAEITTVEELVTLLDSPEI